MPYYRFLWTDDTQEKVESHGVTLDEFEAIVCDPRDTGISKSTGRPVAFGRGDDGRLLICVYELIDDFDVIPITAYEVDDA